ncbi:MAG TPA: SMP-30/gluconolactonase/LRE family protein [Pedomonas sp.]|uniref:SMP-30/gluconolactonase/LRE family protein n=1 Tax=Pedomonas sp. TaxID=2976421 RepID=UPI002F4006AD
MRSRKRSIRLLSIFVVLALCLYAATMLPLTGWFEKLEPHSPGQCVRLAGPVGAEDFAVDWQKRRAYVSSADRHGVEEGKRPGGDIYLLDFSGETPKLTPLNAWPDKDFFPHGLDFISEWDGTRRLFAINHGPNGRDHTVEVFDAQEDGTLRHVRTISSSSFTSPNDIAAVSAEQFYLTNDPFDLPTMERTLNYLGVSTGTVVYYDGGIARPVVENLRFANGISRSPDGQWLLVAESLGRSVTVYQRNPFNGQLVRRSEIAVPMAADNMIVHPDGTTVVAGHPRPLAFLSYTKAPQDRRAPSMVMQLDPQQLPFPAPRRRTLPLPYVNDGNQFSAASVGFIDQQSRLFVGSVYERGVLMCIPQTR